MIINAICNLVLLLELKLIHNTGIILDFAILGNIEINVEIYYSKQYIYRSSQINSTIIFMLVIPQS